MSSQHGAIDPAELRRLPLDGPVNFRDLGGYAVDDGRTVRRRHLFRSDSLHRLSDEDIERVHDLGITTLIDFRTSVELEHAGPGGIAGVDAEHLHLPTFDMTRPPEGAASFLGDLSDAASVYLMMLERGREANAAALRRVATSEDPVVFFCSAGKDRTGLFAALVLSLLGVDDHDVVADYALTGEVVDRIEALRGDNPLTSKVPPEGQELARTIGEALANAYPRTMAATIELVHDRWGGWDGYAAEIGVGDDVLERLRDRLLV